MFEKCASCLSSASSPAMDLATRAAVLLKEDAQKSQEMARTLKRSAQKDKVDLMRRAADKLREMAGDVLGSAIFQGAAGLASAACQLGAGVKGLKAEALKSGSSMTKLAEQAERMTRLARQAERAALVCSVSAKSIDAASSFDGFAIDKEHRAIQKQELETEAEVAGNEAQDQGDAESEAKRLGDSATGLAQKLGDSLHAAALAATRVADR